MGRNKIEFTKEQDDRIKELVNNGHSLNEISTIINDEFNTTFSRSCIDRRIKTLGIIRSEVNRDRKQSISRLANRVEELREWKRRQANNSDTIKEQDIANGMGISVKTLNKMYKQFDIPKRLSSYNRPDIYFDEKQVVDCTKLNEKIREWIYEEIIKQKPNDMRVERDVIVRTEPMTITYWYKDYERNRCIDKICEMDGVNLKLDFYFPDYKTGFYYTDLGFKSFKNKNSDDSVNPIVWSNYLSKFKNGIKLLGFIPIKSLEDRYVDIKFTAKSMIDRARTGEYNHWKYVESLQEKIETEDSNEEYLYIKYE